MHHGRALHSGARESVSSSLGVAVVHDQFQFVESFCTVRFRFGGSLSIACAVCLTMTILGGYVLMANETMKTVNPKVLNYGLIGLNTVPLVLFVVNVVRLKLNHGVGAGKVKVKVVSSTAVVPINELNMNSEVRQWGMADDTKSTKKGGLFLQSNSS